MASSADRIENTRPPSPGQESHAVEIRHSMRFALVGLGFSLLLLCAGTAMVIAPLDAKKPTDIQGYFCCAVGGIFAVASARRLITRRPLLVLSHSGFEMPASRIGQVAWADIEAARVLSCNGVPFLTLGLRNAHALLSRQSLVQKLLTRANRMFYGHLDVGIPLIGLDRPGTEVLDLFDRQIGPTLNRDYLYDLIRVVTKLARRPDKRALQSLRDIFDPAAHELRDEAERVLLYVNPTELVIERQDVTVDISKTPPEAVVNVSLRVTGRMADAQPPETVVMQAKVLLRKASGDWRIRAIEEGRISPWPSVETSGSARS